jgi:hypothetical protein
MIVVDVVVPDANLEAIDELGPRFPGPGGLYRSAVSLKERIILEIPLGSLDALIVIERTGGRRRAGKSEQTSDESGRQAAQHVNVAGYITARANSTLRTCPTPSSQSDGIEI